MTAESACDHAADPFVRVLRSVGKQVEVSGCGDEAEQPERRPAKAHRL
ncbi:hypothetical protein ACFV0B_13125 [Streptomyces xanthophaeus]